MKVKFITCIYSDLSETKLGGRPSRRGHYRQSLLSLLKMNNADFLCYTSENEIEDLKLFFYEQNSVSQKQLEFKVFDLESYKLENLIDGFRDPNKVNLSDRCFEIQYCKFNWWWLEDKSYDYYYWIDAGLSHCGIIPNAYLPHNNGPYFGYFESNLFGENFLNNLVSFTGDKFFVIAKENIRNFWDHPVSSKWYKNFDSSLHIIAGLFGGKRELWDLLIPYMEDYLEKIILTDGRLPSDENILSLTFQNHKKDFIWKNFDTWWHQNSGINWVDENFFTQNKSFYKVLEELMD